MDSKLVTTIGWIASMMAIFMYLSYIDQILRNISGHSGSVIQPIFATLNCSFWTLYGLLKPKIDLPIVVCNVPGIILGIVTAVTAIIY